MSLEQKIEALTAAVETLTAAIKSGGVSTGAAKPSKAEKPAAEPKGYEAKHTKEEMQAALGEVKEKAGAPVAKAIIKDVGKVEKMAEITDPKIIDEVYEAAKKKLAEIEEAM